MDKNAKSDYTTVESFESFYSSALLCDRSAAMDLCTPGEERICSITCINCCSFSHSYSSPLTWSDTSRGYSIISWYTYSTEYLYPSNAGAIILRRIKNGFNPCTFDEVTLPSNRPFVSSVSWLACSRRITIGVRTASARGKSPHKFLVVLISQILKRIGKWSEALVTSGRPLASNNGFPFADVNTETFSSLKSTSKSGRISTWSNVC